MRLTGFYLCAFVSRIRTLHIVLEWKDCPFIAKNISKLKSFQIPKRSKSNAKDTRTVKLISFQILKRKNNGGSHLDYKSSGKIIFNIHELPMLDEIDIKDLALNLYLPAINEELYSKEIFNAFVNSFSEYFQMFPSKKIQYFSLSKGFSIVPRIIEANEDQSCENNSVDSQLYEDHFNDYHEEMTTDEDKVDNGISELFCKYTDVEDLENFKSIFLKSIMNILMMKKKKTSSSRH